MKRNQKWIRKRHLHVKNLMYAPFHAYVKRKYGYTFSPFENKENRNYLILYNHTTGFDQFLLGFSFKKHLIYYVATEDLFSIPVVSSVINFLVRPIPFKKSTNDTRAVINCMKVAKEGASIALSPEGNRTYSGKTESIKASIAKFAKSLKLPIAFFVFEGGYGVKPRWADKVRKGKMHGAVKKVLEYDEYKDMPNEDLYELIVKNLYNDDTLTKNSYEGKHKAEYIERALYVCPNCGLSKFESKLNRLKCLNCDLELEYNNHLRFEKIKGDKYFDNIRDWYDYQSNYINKLDLESLNDDAIYEDKVKLFEVIVYKRKKKISSKCILKMYKDHYELFYKKNVMTLNFDDITATSVLGKNKMNIYIGDNIYQIKADKRFNAVKYVNIYYRYKNIKENKNEQFLGL